MEDVVNNLSNRDRFDALKVGQREDEDFDFDTDCWTSGQRRPVLLLPT